MTLSSNRPVTGAPVRGESDFLDAHDFAPLRELKPAHRPRNGAFLFIPEVWSDER